jgi:predicted dehydrogenase
MITVGVIGCGYWGPKLIRNFHEISGAQLVWACDYDQSKLDHIKALYPYVRTTRDYQEMLASDVEAVAIATPVSTHYRLAMDCLQAGKHILIEKPMTTSVKQAEAIVRLGEQIHRVVMVGHTFQYNPAVEAVRRVVASGELGEIYYINSTRVNLGLFQTDVNVLWDLAPHDLSILCDVLGMEPVAVSARGGVFVQKDKGIHEIAHMALQFPQGIMADLRVSWLDPFKIRRMTIVGSRKMLVYDDLAEDKVCIFDKGVDIPPYPDGVDQARLTYRNGGVSAVPIQWVEPLRQECEDFIRCIHTGERPRSDGHIGLKVVRILEAAQISLLDSGLPVNVATLAHPNPQTLYRWQMEATYAAHSVI